MVTAPSSIVPNNGTRPTPQDTYMSPKQKKAMEAFNKRRAELERTRQNGPEGSQEKVKKKLFDNFQDVIKMIVESMKHQDPTSDSKFDPKELMQSFLSMAQTMASLDMTKKMDEQIAQNNISQALQASENIGNMVEVTGSEIYYDPEEGSEMSFTLPDKYDFAALQIEVYDSSNRIVSRERLDKTQNGLTYNLYKGNTAIAGKEKFGQDARELFKPGKHKWTIDGRPKFAVSEEEKKVAENMRLKIEKGKYRVKVTPLDANGQVIYNKYEDRPLKIPTTVQNRIVGVPIEKGQGHFDFNGPKSRIQDLVGIYSKNNGFKGLLDASAKTSHLDGATDVKQSKITEFFKKPITKEN